MHWCMLHVFSKPVAVESHTEIETRASQSPGSSPVAVSRSPAEIETLAVTAALVAEECLPPVSSAGTVAVVELSAPGV